MLIAFLTFEGYNELDSLIVLGVLNRIRKTDWRVSIASPSPRVRSMNGVVIESHISLEEASTADAVIVGSGRQTREVVAEALMARLQLDPSRQLLGAQCSGTLVLARLGLLGGVPACTRLDEQAVGPGGRRRGARSTVIRQGQRRHGRRLPLVGLSRGLDDRPPGRCRSSDRRSALRRAGRRKGRVRRTRAAQYRPVPGPRTSGRLSEQRGP